MSASKSEDGQGAAVVPGKAHPNRWTVRDVLTFVVFTVVIMILTMALKMAEDLVLSPQNTFFVGSWLFPLAATPFYLAMADRIGKRGVLAASILVFGLLYSSVGTIYCAPIAVVAAVAGELAMAGKGSYRRPARAVGGYYLFWVAFGCYGIVPFLLFREAYEKQLGALYSTADVQAMVAQYTELPWILLMLLMFAVGTVLGGLIGAKFLKKHVRKAKIA